MVLGGVTRAPYTGELPAKGSTRYVRLHGVVQPAVVQPYQEELVRELGGCISARLPTGVYRNFYPHELKRSPGDCVPATRRSYP
jgi:hypothetical protein